MTSQRTKRRCRAHNIREPRGGAELMALQRTKRRCRVHEVTEEVIKTVKQQEQLDKHNLNTLEQRGKQ